MDWANMFNRTRSALDTCRDTGAQALHWLSGRDGPRHRRLTYRISLGAGLAVMAYYPLGMLWTNQINDDPDFQTPKKFEVAGGSHAAEMVIALVDREVNHTAWPSNDPWFFPGSALSRMPQFQQGMFYVLGRYTQELQEVLARPRGTSQMDRGLEQAQGMIKYAPDAWILNFKVSIWPQATALSQYRAANADFIDWDKRLASGKASYDIRADNLLSLLDRVIADLGDLSGSIENGLGHRSSLLFVPTPFYDPTARDVLYRNKGVAYGYLMILRETGRDFERILALKNVHENWSKGLEALRAAAVQRPVIVSNTSQDEWFFNTHLASQGYDILRARAKLVEVRDIISK